MNILFVSLEESGKKISCKILEKLSLQNISHTYYTFGLDGNFSSNIIDINNIKIKPLMGFFEVIKNVRYIYKLRSHLISQVQKFNIEYIFFIDSFDFSKFFYNKFNKIKCSQIVGPSVFIWKKKKQNILMTILINYSQFFLLINNTMILISIPISDTH